MKIVLSVLLLAGVAVAKNKFPSYIELCPNSVKEAGPCILKNVQKMKPHMEKGIPELLIPCLNPFEIVKAKLATPGLTATFSNAKMYNLHKFNIKKLSLNLDTLALELDIEFPVISCSADYELVGKMLVLQLNSHGTSSGNFTDLFAHITGKGVFFEKNGKKYIKIEDTKIDLKIQDAYLNFEKLFGDNQALTDNANKVMNENIHEVLKEFVPVVSETVSNIVVGSINKIFEKFCYKELFP